MNFYESRFASALLLAGILPRDHLHIRLVLSSTRHAITTSTSIAPLNPHTLLPRLDELVRTGDRVPTRISESPRGHFCFESRFSCHDDEMQCWSTYLARGVGSKHRIAFVAFAFVFGGWSLAGGSPFCFLRSSGHGSGCSSPYELGGMGCLCCLPFGGACIVERSLELESITRGRGADLCKLGRVFPPHGWI